MISVILIFFTAFLISILVLPRIIHLAHIKRLFDDSQNNERKIHQGSIPNLGGVAIFMAILLSQTLIIDPFTIPNNFLISSAIILFMIGLKDDLLGISPNMKFLAQFAVAFILVYAGDIRFVDMGNIFNLNELPYLFSLALSFIFIVGLINSYNLIDGIDGLATIQGLIFSLIFSILFYQMGEIGWTLLAIALAGSLLGFLRYNFSPAKIFMGDCGALLIGFYASVFCISFIDMAQSKELVIGTISITSPYGIISALIMLPVFDTLRVFTLRICKNGSPFKADRNHLHHRLLDLGLTHTQVSISLGLLTFIFSILSFYLQPMGNAMLVLTLFIIMLAINIILYIFDWKKSINFSNK